MLSRVAESIYWMSRYIERTENLARFIDVNLNMMLDRPDGTDEQWMPLVNATGDHEEFSKRYELANRQNVVQFLTFDTDYPNSIISCLRSARENARSVREVIPSEMWEHLNHFYFSVKDAAGHRFESPHEFFQQVKASCQMFVGIGDCTMSRGEGWHFGQLGKMIERADKTTRIVDVKYYTLLPSVQDVGTPIDDLQWSAVLNSVSGFEMYRKQHHGIRPKTVVAFLLLDRLFPRAVMHCIDAANHSLHAITASPEGTFWNLAEKRLGQLRGQLAYTHVDEIISQGLHEYLDAMQTRLNLVGAAIHEVFFSLEPSEESGDQRTQLPGSQMQFQN